MTVDEKHHQTKDAFATTVPADDQESRDISAALDRVNLAIQKHSGALMGNAWDTDRLCDELDRLNALAAIPATQKPQFYAGFHSTAPASLANQPGLAWKKHQIKKIVLSGNRREAIAYVLEYHDNGTVLYTQKVRWWLRKSGSQWKVWDMESLEAGMRMSTITATTITAAEAAGASSPLLSSLTQLQAVVTAAQQGDVKKTETELRKLDNVTLPPEIDAIRQYLWGAIHLRQKRYSEVLKDCDGIAAGGLDFPGIHEFRTLAYNHLGQYEQAVKSAHAWEESLGGDREVYFELGSALAHLNQPDLAADAFRKSLDDDPDASGSLAELSHVLPAGKKDELATRFAHCQDPAKVFFDTITNLQKARDHEGMQILLEAYRADNHAANDPWLTYYDAELKVIGKKYAEAELELKTLLPVATTKDRQVMVEEYIDVARLAGHAGEGYANAPDPVAAFKQLAGPLFNAKSTETLRHILTTHLAKFPKDPWAYYYQARLDANEGKDEEADAIFAKAMSLARKAADTNTFRYTRVVARFTSGQGLLAYKQIVPQEKVFLQLAQLYRSHKQADGLAALVAARKVDAPADASIPLWDAQANFLAADYTSALALLETCRPTDTGNANSYMWSDLYIRSQVRLKHFDAARTEANRGVGADKNSWHIALVECAAGNVRAATDALNAWFANDEHTDASDFYADPDIGPALQTPAFSEWRIKHPNPATRPAPSTRE